MRYPRAIRCVWGPALAAVLVCGAAAQPADFTKRLTEGQQLRAQSRFADARAMYQALLRDLRNDPPHYVLEGLVYDRLGLDEQDSGDYAAAETAFNHGLAAVHAQNGDDLTVILLKTHLAELYIAEARPDDAEGLLRPSVAALKSSTLPDPIALATATEDLAVVCIMRHKLVEPEGLLRESQALLENAAGPDDPRLTSTLMTYAGLMTAQHRSDEALQAAERAWKVLSSSPAPIAQPYAASVLSVMGAVYFHAGRVAEAEKFASRAVELAANSLGLTHPRLGLYLNNYAVILKSNGHKSEAKAVHKKAEEIIEQNSSGSGGYTVNVASLR